MGEEFGPSLAEVDPEKAWKGIPTPRLLPIEPLISRAKSTLESLRHLRADIRPLSLLSPVTIRSANLTGERISYGGSRYFFPNSSARWEVLYHNDTQAPWFFDYRQEVDGAVDEKKRNILKGGENLSVVTPFRVTEPVRATAKSECKGIARTFDSVKKDFDIGILRYKERPLSEFPDERGTCGTDWKGWDSRQEQRLQIVEFRDTFSSALRIGDILYRPPGRSIIFTRETRVKNRSGVTVEFIYIGSLLLANVYEDGNKVCAVVGHTDKYWYNVKFGETITHVQSIVVPDWMYGRVFLWNSIVTKPPKDSFMGPHDTFIARKEYRIGDMVPS